MAAVDYYVDAQVAMITLTNGKAGNLLNLESLHALHEAFTSAFSDDNVRVVTLRAEGDPFCLGMDLGLLESVNKNHELIEKTVDLYVSLLTGMYTGPKPVIAMIQGAVKAGGMGLVGACDIVLASENASFELSEVILGLIPANVMPFIFSLRLPPQKLRYLTLTAKRLSATEAKLLNLVDEVMEVEKCGATLKAVIKGLFRSSPKALAETKAFTQLLVGEKLDAASQLAKDKLIELIKRPEVINAIRAFNEGETPDWFDKFKPEKPLIVQGEK